MRTRFLLLVLACLAAGPSAPPPPKSVAEQLAELQKQLRQREEALAGQLEKVQAELEKLHESAVAGRLELVKKYPADPGVFPALEYLVLEDTPHAGLALDVIARHHLNAPQLGKLCLFLSEGDEATRPQTLKLLRLAVARGTRPEVMGLARLALARLLYARGEAEGAPAAVRAKALGEAETLLAEVVERYAGLKLPGEGARLAGEEARPMLFELRHLANGRTVPEIDGFDLGGKAMRLSEHRGKVVLLGFWSFDCEACQAALPALRGLVKAHAGRPFVLVGINGDDPINRPAFLEKESVPWRSFPNQRPGRKDLSEGWNLKVWPTLYLIDHAGVIRRRWQGMPDEKALLAAVEGLVARAGAAK
jgi:thiol-disulfide isomerase/thioredoxin